MLLHIRRRSSRSNYVRRRFWPGLEVLEDRRLLAQILFGGSALKETFDDVSPLGLSGTMLDDPGYLNGVPVGMAVFHHDIQGDGFLTPGGDTTPTLQPPGQTKQDLFFEFGAGGTDTITIHPYLPAGAGTAEVDEVALDIKSQDSIQVTLVGQNGQETLSAAPSGSPLGSSFTTVAASNTDVGKDAAGNNIQIGPITQVVVHTGNFMELDNVHAVVFFPGIVALPPVAKDDVYELPQGAMPGQIFQSKDIALRSSALGSVLDNDSSSLGRQLRGRPVTLPAHGQLVWASNDDGAFSYTPDSTFQGTDSFTYVANDQTTDSAPANVTIVSKGSQQDSDGDGVPDYVEALAPPNKNGVRGDGNNDGTPDYLESKVASLPAADNQYWTLVASGGSFRNVSSAPTPSAPPLPGGVTLTSGLFKFQNVGLAPGEPAVVTLTPDSGLVPTGANGFYVLNPNSAGWSGFNLDPVTGIGAVVSGTDVTVHLPGSASGVVTLQGGPANIQLTAYPGDVTFVHQPGDMTIPLPLTGRVTGVAPPGDPVTFSKVPGSEVGGRVDLNPDGSFVWHGSDPEGSFQFRVTDAGGASTGPAFETIHIRDTQPLLFGLGSMPSSPTAPITYGFGPDTTTEFGNDFDAAGNMALSLKRQEMDDRTSLLELGLFFDVKVSDRSGVLGRATDIGFNNLSIIVVKPPIRAAEFSLHPDGTFTYLPLSGFRGRESFEIKVNDGYLDSNTATVDIIVNTVPNLPAPTPNTPYPASEFPEAEVQVPVAVAGLGTRQEEVVLTNPDPNANVAAFQAVANPSPARDYPPGTTAANFPIGFFQFTETGLPNGPDILLKLSLPPDAQTPTEYFKFGPTPDNPTPHWYDFAFDANTSTGALFPGQVDPLTGNVLPVGQIYLHFRDGQRGDDDLAANGVIADAGGPTIVTPPAQPEARFIAAVYQTLLNRQPEPAGLSFWVGLLDKGVARQQVVEGIYDSPEHRGVQVDQYYATYLHRVADPAGRAFWVSTMLAGVSETDVALGFLTSDEYFRNHPDATSFVSGLYRDILGRAPDPAGLAHWLSLDALPQGPVFVADGILTSVEGDQRLLGGLYAGFLHRRPDSTGQTGWLAALRSDPNSTAVVATTIVSSDEFFARAEAGIL